MEEKKQGARLDVLGRQHVVALVALELAVCAQRAQRLKGQVGADRVRAVAHQRAEVVHLRACLSLGEHRRL